MLSCHKDTIDRFLKDGTIDWRAILYNITYQLWHRISNQNKIIPALADRLMTSPHVYDRKVYQRVEAKDVQKEYEKFDFRVMALRPHKSIGFKV